MSRSWLTPRRILHAALTLIVFGVAWYYSAYPRGMFVAWVDDLRGHQEIKTYGMPAPWSNECSQLVWERYGVMVHPVAGCVVTESLVWYVGGYNSVAAALIQAKFGKDIFAECAGEARAAWAAAHPEERNERKQEGDLKD